MGNHKTDFVQAIMTALAWLIGSLGYALPCNAGCSPMKTYVVSSHSVLIATLVSLPGIKMRDAWHREPVPHDLKPGEDTVCTLLPDQGLYQCDPVDSGPVRVQITNGQALLLGQHADAQTKVLNSTFPEEAVNTIVDDLQQGAQRQQEIQESASKPLLEWPTWLTLTKITGTVWGNKGGNNDKERDHHATLEEDTGPWR